MQISVCSEGLSLCEHLHCHVFVQRGPLGAGRADHISLVLHIVVDLEGVRCNPAQG